MLHDAFWRRRKERQSWVSNDSHRPPPYFEWRYLHFVTPDGVAMNVVLHETDIFGRDDSPYVSLTLFRPGKAACYFRRELQPPMLSRGQRYERAGSDLLVDSGHHIFVDVEVPGQISLKGELIKLAHPLIFGNGLLFADGKSGRAGYWRVAAPHASFTAQLHFEGEVSNLRGMAYQDHQWGTLPLQEIVADWTWGHFSNPQLGLVFFQVRTQRGQLIQRVAVMSKSDRFTDTNLESDFLEIVSSAAQPEDYAGSIKVGLFSNNLQLAFTLSPAGLMRQRLNERLGDKVASYLRWAATGTYQDACARHDVYGISEYIRIRPHAYGSLPESEHRQHHLWSDNGD